MEKGDDFKSLKYQLDQWEKGLPGILLRPMVKCRKLKGGYIENFDDL